MDLTNASFFKTKKVDSNIANGVYSYIDCVDTRDYGVGVSGDGTLATPTREYEVFQIPGRNGDIIRDAGRWNNVTITYDCFISANSRDEFFSKYRRLCKDLLSVFEYVRIEDSYMPDRYRMGRCVEVSKPEVTPGILGGSFVVTFDCMPQLYYKDESAVIDLTNENGSVNLIGYDKNVGLDFRIRIAFSASWASIILNFGGCTLRMDNPSDLDTGIIDIYFPEMRAYKFTPPQKPVMANYLVSWNNIVPTPEEETATMQTINASLISRPPGLESFKIYMRMWEI